MNEQIEQQNLDVLVKTYLTLRGEREKLAAEFDTKERAIKDFILEHQAVDLLQRRIHQSNFKSFLSEHTIEAEGLPPGVSIFRELNITVRKPTSR